MRISILILAFKNPGQLRKLVDVLKKDFEVYIHFDKNSNIDSSFRDEPHVHILKKRQATYWGSQNTLLAVLEMLRIANNDGSDYNILISAQDLPLKTNREIRAFITDNYHDYLYHFPLTKDSWGGKGIDRISLYWEDKVLAKNIISSGLAFGKKVGFGLIRAAQKILGLKRSMPFEAHGGSFCLNLTRESSQYILEFTQKNKWFTDRFAYTRCADEIFFQTILLGFDYAGKNNIVNDDIRFQDWESGPAYPRVFTIEDYERCINAAPVFGRKFDEQIDAEIIDKILQYVSRDTT
jgi:hypothetical protein